MVMDDRLSNHRPARVLSFPKKQLTPLRLVAVIAFQGHIYKMARAPKTSEKTVRRFKRGDSVPLVWHSISSIFTFRQFQVIQ